MFVNPNDTKNLKYHANDRKCDGLLCYMVDSLQWKNIVKYLSRFGNESR